MKINIENFDEIKKQMLKSENYLADYATKSHDAIRLKPIKSDIRLEYEHDADKIIHSLSYTRYIDKTQVYSDRLDDNISKRMTHVQFVSRTSRTIARALGLNEDLCEAISLGHDIGHVPYAHEGEKFLNEISKKNLNEIFAHNVQSVRNFMLIEKNGEGLNLTIQTLDGMLCHNGEMLSNVYEPKIKSLDEFINEYNQCYIDEDTLKTLRPMTIEGCIVRISDIIGYIGKDIEDSILLGLFNRNMIPKDISDVLGNTNEEIMNTVILDIIENSYSKKYIKMSNNVFEALNKLKKFNYQNIYSKSLTKQNDEKIKKMFYDLFYYYLDVLENKNIKSDIYKVFLNNMNKKYIQKTSNKRMIIDYIAGMTDRYMESMYEVNILKDGR